MKIQKCYRDNPAKSLRNNFPKLAIFLPFSQKYTHTIIWFAWAMFNIRTFIPNFQDYIAGQNWNRHMVAIDMFCYLL